MTYDDSFVIMCSPQVPQTDNVSKLLCEVIYDCVFQDISPYEFVNVLCTYTQVSTTLQ